MQAKKAVVWIVAAATFMLGYWLGASEEPAEAQFGTDSAILRELREIRDAVESIEECVGPHSYRSYGCAIEVEAQ